MAAAVPSNAAGEIWEGLAPLRERFTESRWIGADKMHLTVVFLGGRSPDVVPRYAHALAELARSHSPIRVETREAGGRARDRRGGVAWLRIGLGARELSALAVDVDAALGLYSYGERLQPRPHLTVARRVDESTIAALSDWALTRPRFAWHVDRLVLLRSHMGPAGSRYEELASTLLTGRGNAA